MLRRPVGAAGTWHQRCMDWLTHCARTLPADFYRADTAVPWVRVLSALFGPSGLCT